MLRKGNDGKGHKKRAEESMQIQEKLINFSQAERELKPEGRAARGHVTRGITVRESQYASPLVPAFFPLFKLVAGDPLGAIVVVGDVVPPAAVIGALVGSKEEAGAVLPDPVAQAVILLLVNLAFLPLIKLVAVEPHGAIEVVGDVVKPAAA